MRLIKVGSAILNQTPLDWKNNQGNILAAIREAKEKQVSILCLPELCITGYGCEDSFYSYGLQQSALEVLQEIVPECKGIVVSLGLPLFFEYGLFNASCLVADGKIIGFACKQFLANEGIHYEPRWFKPWPSGKSASIKVGAAEYPLGDLHFTCEDLKIGFEICEDAWVPNRPGRKLAQKGVDIILNPSASHFAFGKFEIRKRFVLEGSRAFGTSYIYSNLSGNEAGRAIYDGGALIASGGRLLAQGPRFIFSDIHLTTAQIDIDVTRLIRARGPDCDMEADVAAGSAIEFDFRFPQIAPESTSLSIPVWENSQHLKEEEFGRAVALGLFDYMRKSRSNGFVVSLSGGADSSAITCLVSIMVDLAIKELGSELFQTRLNYIRRLSPGVKKQDYVKQLLTCVYQATKNSSSTTLNAARIIAAAVSAEFQNIDVSEIVDLYTQIGERAVGRKLNWIDDDISLQNIQARVRGPSVWMITNLRGSLLLATSNRSEAAVGYTTMDGDTCGGLSPIAGIDKAFLRSWLKWLEKEGLEGYGKIPELIAVNAQEPTAELRPGDSGQTDEGDLMPYELLDFVERLAIRDKKTPKEVLSQTRVAFQKYDLPHLKIWVERFFKLWCRNQWKRERYAPSFHLDDESLDPRTWCRFPILSGGYEREIVEMNNEL